MSWIYLLGAIVTFPIAYWKARKTLSIYRGDSVDNFLHELMSILATLLGAMAWPLTWVAYLISKGVQKHEESLPEGYFIQVTDKGGEFEAVGVWNERGERVSSKFTSIYGLDGAANEAIQDALKILKIEGRNDSEYEELYKKYNRER